MAAVSPYSSTHAARLGLPACDVRIECDRCDPLRGVHARTLPRQSPSRWQAGAAQTVGAELARGLLLRG